MIESKYGLETVYGDTDSLFIDLNRRVTKSNLGDIVNFSKDMAAVVTKKFKKPIELKFEKVYWPAILESKKRYFGYPWEGAYKKGKHNFEAKGIETVRRDGVQITQKIMMQGMGQSRTRSLSMSMDVVTSHVLTHEKLSERYSTEQ